MPGDDEQPGGLSPDEQAFFDTRGETAPAQEAVESAAKAEEPTPATSEEATEGEQEAPAKEPRHVPLSELIQERKKRQDFEKQLAEQREQWARADERLRALAEAQQARQQPEQPQLPDPNEDPLAAVDYLFRQNQQREQQDRERQAQEQQARQQHEQVQQVLTTYQARAQEFAAETPDFMDAYNHVRETRTRQLAVQGFTPQEVQQVLVQDELAFAARALERGANPGEQLYELAKVYGYQPKAADLQPDPAALIEAKAETVAKARSLSQAGGQASAARIDAKALASMSDDDFAAYMEQQGGKGFRRALNA